MASTITQCPFCQTSFKLNEDQLQAADGFARCGACLKVFDANKHRLNLRDNNSPEQPANRQEPVYQEILQETRDLPVPELFGQELDPGAYQFSEPEVDSNPLEEIIEGPEFLAQDSDLRTPTGESDNSFGRDAGTGGEFAFTIKEEKQSGNEAQTPGPDPTDPVASVQDEEKEMPESDPGPGFTIDQNFQDGDELPPVSAAELSAINTQPVEIEREDHSGKRLVAALLMSANVMLLVLLASQYVWFNLESLARNPRYRPALEGMCQVLGCEFRESRDIAAILAEELVVRSHPTRENALEVNFIFRNSAPFEQDFPLVELSFSSINNELIANRSFTPNEYLPAVLQNLEKMPAGTPVQVSLEILDPGVEAVNYTMAFRLPQGQ